MGIASKFCQDCYFCPEISLIPSEYRVKESEYLNPTQPACIFKYFPNKKKWSQWEYIFQRGLTKKHMIHFSFPKTP